jgi:hypothetical protein
MPVRAISQCAVLPILSPLRAGESGGGVKSRTKLYYTP